MFYPVELVSFNENWVWSTGQAARMLQGETNYDITLLVQAGVGTKTPEETVAYFEQCTTCQNTLNQAISNVKGF